MPEKGLSIPVSGKLIAVEGLDGSGKSTQVYLLKRWLELSGYKVFFTEWNSSDIVRSATRRGKKQNLLTPTTFSLIHCTDFADRYQPDITFYFSLPLRTALDRILVGRPALKYHEAGMDLGLSPDPVECFKIFQGRIHKAYEALARRHRFTRIDSDRPVETIQEEVRAILRDRIDLAQYKTTVPRGWR